MKDEKKAPKLRFKGFTDDWEQCKLGDVFAERSEKSQDGNEELLSVTLKDGVIKSESLDRKNTASLDKRNYKLVIPNDIAYNSMRMWQGALGVSKFSGIVSPAYTVIKLRNQLENPYFYQYYFKKNEMLNVFRKNSQGLTSDTWNLKYPLFSRIRFFTASTREQQQISSLLYLLDQTITLHEEKKHQLERLKSALLQKMFADKSGYPDIRFEGFSDEWEQCKLGDVADFSKGTGYSKSDLKGTGSPIILYGRLYTKYETIIRNVDSFVVPKSGSVFSKGGEVIVPGSGETAEDISIASVVEPAGILLGGDLNIIYPNSDLDPTFLAITISNGKPHFDMARRAQGKSIVHLHNADLKHISLKTPNLSEQKRISKIFEVLDQTITLHDQKLNLLKLVKQSLLQNMFI
ncbi:restriction endonuclease subunit S [Lactobacillus delbrueckii subsp. bulgaricus]